MGDNNMVSLKKISLKKISLKKISLKKISLKKISLKKIYYVKDEYKTHKKMTIKEIYASRDGTGKPSWVWFVVKYQGKAKSIGYGFVKGLFPEWGTFYMQDLSPSLGIYPVPENQWKDFENVVQDEVIAQ